MFKSLDIRKNKSNIVLAYAIIAMGLIVLSILLMWKHSIEQAEVYMQEIEGLRQATVYIDKMRQVALARTSTLYKIRSSDDPFELDELNIKFSAFAGEFIKVRDKFLNLKLSPEVRAIWLESSSVINGTDRTQRKVAALFINGKGEEGDKVLLNEALVYQTQGQQYLSKMLDVQQTKSETSLTQALRNKRKTYVSIFVIGTIALILSIGIMLFIVRFASQLQKGLLYADEAKLASQMKSDFLAKMSHEIRTPLGAILGFAEASLNSGQTMDDRIIGTQRIIHNARHLLGLINDILDLSKVESGKLEIEHIAVSPIQIANEACNVVKVKADEKQLSYGVNFVLPLPREIQSDPTRMKQVLINLMSNAIKFTEHGHVYLNVSYSAHYDKVCFEIEDTGIGISEKQQSKIFNAFTQADSSTTRKYGGTGLGLNLSKDLVLQMGGELSVKSKTGVGSKFIFTLDSGKQEDLDFIYELSQVEEHENTLTKEKKIRKPLQGKVLLVEDNEDNQRIIGCFIESTGAEVTLAENGLKALDLYQKIKEFDLIFMDMQMPFMDGPTATEKLREFGCGTPIIALTANAFKEDRMRCLSAGSTDFVTKPISQDGLYDLLSHYLVEAKEIKHETKPIISTLISEEPKLEKIVNRYIGRLPAATEKIKQASLSNNWDEMKELMHASKGSAGMAGFAQLSDMAAQIDFQLRNKDYVNVQGLIGKYENIVNRIISGKNLDSTEIH